MQNPLSLSALLTAHGSDKNTDHSYGPFYDELAEILLQRNKPLNIMEIGVDSGASIKAFQAYFQERATLYGVDLKKDSFRSLGPEVRTYLADQSKPESLRGLLLSLQYEGTLFDLIIDDASHARDDQLRTVEILWPLLAPGGYYVIEDLQHRESAKLFVHLPGFRLVDLRDIKNRCDDMLVVMRKGSQTLSTDLRT